MAVKTKRKQIEQTESKAILDSVKDISINDVVSQVNNLQVTVQKTLADLCATVTIKVQQMEQLDSAIGIKDERLQELHNIEKEAISLDEMRSQRDQERLDWDLERQNREKRRLEDEAEFIKARNRKEDEWKYEFEQKKKRLQEDFDAEAARNKRAEQVRVENLERGWTDRENSLKSKEAEHQSLQQQVTSFETKLAEAVKKAQGEGYGSATSKFTHEIALLKKDAEADKKVADMRIVALSAQIEGLTNQIEDMQKQLLLARQDAKEVATEALKSASNKQLSDTLQKVISEQQMNTKK